MCNFFSLVSDGKGEIMYFDWELRQKCLLGELNFEPDSHTSIATHFGYRGEKEDKLNKYEYNPLTRKFVIDQLNTKDDSQQVRQFCESLNFKTIVPQLIIKPIINTLHVVRQTNEVTEHEIELLKQWASVRASVWDSVGASVGASIWASVGASVWGSIWASVGVSVRASVWDSVGVSVWVYISSFFDIFPDGNPYQRCIDLWELGLIPSFDGATWRLHLGKGAIVVYEMIV